MKTQAAPKAEESDCGPADLPEYRRPMTFEEWVDATSKGASLRDDAKPRIHTTAYDTLSGDVEEEELQKPVAASPPVDPLSARTLSMIKRPLGQPSLSK